MYPGSHYRVFASLLSGLLLFAAGCCSFGDRLNHNNIAEARELTSHGLSAMHRGRCGDASRLLQQACDTCPDDSRIRRHLANSLVQQGQVDQAIGHLKLAIEQSADDPALHVDLGNLYLRQGQPHAARQQSMLALQYNRQMPQAWLLRGRSERAANQLDQAVDSLHRAAGYEPACAETRLELARTWLQMGEPLRAMTALEIHNAGFADDQIPMEALDLTGRALVDLQQYDRAAWLLTNATNRPDVTPDIWILLSRSQLLSGDASSAQLSALSAQHAFPDNSAIAEWLAQLTSDTDSSLHAAR